MIKVLGLNNKEFILNEDHIEKIENVPETLITLSNGKKYLIKNSIDEVIEKIIKYKKNIFSLGLREESKR
ncbi:flagellar protein FlbD [Clostridium acetireducens DSM 10703]|jgi:flagellar protein FlbD|uniref:Flagellar protein FlbD n=1 Tax=Clostridium acetireducens DSM 10703 TaxID=1121290 RepID=A0A1E8F0I4_9CLOT|nr:flagellar FlbD family protein [Clostridium acetireducens]OFI06813.1 flagellar protein FlbD [Clostridium acetireducens DSM 10703]